jgi:hypothetical protein
MKQDGIRGTVMDGLGASCAVLLLALVAGVSAAQPPEDAAPAPPPAAEQPEAEDTEDADAGDAADDVFIPSDEIQADEEVTFPVDI